MLFPLEAAKLKARAELAEQELAAAAEVEEEDEELDLEVSHEDAMKQNWIIRPVECLSARKEQCEEYAANRKCIGT